ncbi:MAG: response regulator, partial [Chitinimonas sp.]|nr:response regulator [Chitinimonas sp.]
MQATKILIVDDDPLQLRRMAGILGAHYAIDTLDRGAGFKEALARYAPDLVILDIELPDVNGIALCRELKAHSETAATPVVFHSSHDTLDERMEAYEAGGEDFLLKSMGADELLAKVGIMLEWISRNRLLAKEEQAARAAADAVKHDLSEIGIALEALRQMGVSDDMQSLARVGVDALSDWRIDAN